MSRYDYGWSPYVPVAARHAKALKMMDKLRKKGVDIQPVERIKGRIIARSFWGKGWCDHLDSFGDYSNRLPRGRTYVRNGSVCHLAIAKGTTEAMVSGSELYTVNITIEPLAKPKWKSLKKQCTGKIGSLLELLQGRLSDEIMDVVTNRKKGLFPLPGEITYECNCPDWAGMCKHIAAVIYGIGARLDERPELLFLLRGVDHEELIDADAATAEITGGKSRRSRRRSLADDALEDVFGVELEDTPDASQARRPKTRKPAKRKTAKKKPAAKKSAATKKATVPKKRAAKKTLKIRPAAKKSAPATKKPARKKLRPFKPTPRTIAKLRKNLAMTRPEFARALGVSAQSVKNWEESTAPLNPNTRSLAGLVRLHQQTAG